VDATGYGFPTAPGGGRQLVKYGYRYGDVPLAEVNAIKEGTRIVPKYHMDNNHRIPVATTLGIHVDGAATPHGDNHDIPSIVAGVCKRIAGQCPQPRPELLTGLREFARTWVRANLVPIDEGADVSVESWLANSNYSPTRVRQIKHRYQQMYNGCIHPSSRRSRVVKCFVKDESYIGYKHLRSIYARVDDTKLAIGPYFKHMERMVYANRHFVKHVPVKDRAELLHERFKYSSRVVGSDYSSYEKHFDLDTFTIELELYSYMLTNIPQGKWILEMISGVLRGMNYCKYTTVSMELPSGRMSGEMNTSLGNGFVNLMLFLYVNQTLGNTNVDCLVEGDDLVGTYEGQELTPVHYQQLGYTIVLKQYRSASEASFCGLVHDEEDQISVADPTKIMLTIGWTSTRYIDAPNSTLIKLLRAKGYSTLYQYAGAPIIQSLANYILRVTKGSTYKIPVEWTFWQQKNIFSTNVKVKVVGIRTRMLVERVFGYSITEQLDLEEYFDNCTRIQPIPLDKVKATPDQVEYFRRFVRAKIPGLRNPAVYAQDKTTVEKKRMVNQMCSVVDHRPYHEEYNPSKRFTIHPPQRDVEPHRLRGGDVSHPARL